MRLSVGEAKGAAGSFRNGCTLRQPRSSCTSSLTQLVYSVRKLCTGPDTHQQIEDFGSDSLRCAATSTPLQQAQL